MANALSRLSMPPPAPNPAGQNDGSASNGLAPAMPPMGGMGAGGVPPGMGGPPGSMPQNVPPPPTHQQTVAALRHFSAIEQELGTLLADPDIGRADMHSKIIDGTTRLVADGILTPAMAVAELGSVPDRPFDQKMWLERNYTQTIAAQTAILQHHQMAGPEAPQGEPYTPDNHQAIMTGLMSQYKGSGNA